MEGFSDWPWKWILGIGGALGVLLIMNRKTVAEVAAEVVSALQTVVQAGQEAAFLATIPNEAAEYADVILQVANETGVSPFVIVALGMRESRWGQALKPRGPGGTGDFAPRNGATPPDGGGWGRGLMQVDYASNQAWLAANDWSDPVTNIRQGVSLLQGKMKYFSSPAGADITLTAAQAKKRGTGTGPFPDPRPLSGDDLIRASISAYNTGEGNVLKSLAAGVDPDITSTGGNYADDVLSNVTEMASNFQDKTGTAPA